MASYRDSFDESDVQVAERQMSTHDPSIDYDKDYATEKGSENEASEKHSMSTANKPRNVTKMRADDDPVSIFPRYAYCRRHVENICGECHDLYEHCGLDSLSKVPTFKKVVVFHISWTETHHQRHIGEMSKMKTTYDHLIGYLRANTQCLILAPLEDKHLVLRSQGLGNKMQMVMFYVDDNTFIDGDQRNKLASEVETINKTALCSVSTDSNMEKEIDRMLEQFVYRFLAKELERLELLLRLPIYKLSHVPETQVAELIKQGNFSKDNSLLLKIEAYWEDISDMEAEIIAMFSRSGLSDDDKPKVKVAVTTVSKEIFSNLTDDVLAITGTIGLGFRYGVLQINVDENANRDEIEAKIKAVMNTYQLGRYTCRFVCTDMTHYRAVNGDTIGTECEVLGTLGGFVEEGKDGRMTTPDDETEDNAEVNHGTTKKDEVNDRQRHNKELYALLSMHVAKQIPDGRLHVHALDSSLLLGHIVPPLPEVSLDISIAKVDPEMINRCGVTYTTEDKLNNRRVEIVPSDFLDRLAGAPVYIWGAKSDPGLGKIVIPNYEAGVTGSHVVVEDRSRRFGAFCQPGDSGAIIFTEDPQHPFIYAVAIVVGEYKSREKPASQKRQYVGLHLQAGLEELRRRHNKPLQFVSELSYVHVGTYF